jgi:hypothetical protein
LKGDYHLLNGLLPIVSKNYAKNKEFFLENYAAERNLFERRGCSKTSVLQPATLSFF